MLAAACSGERSVLAMLLGLVEAALQADDQRQVLADAAVGAGLGDRLAQKLLRLREFAGQHIGHAELESVEGSFGAICSACA